ncbi:Hypothetical protein R9X50_00103000 [Acrodontium crateriforme]|uniref:Telomere-associated protein Rif1 N-terminal domain-containing protein n=1 Tax=Acrodontium crateriforme TaxID=150365 RepID=A0AAQ3R9P6_9PEZI|nr:Hypothetical protein R9X50_00103000 [Acrodontium crateriforme]
MHSSSSSIFDTLPERPPTPPHVAEAIEDALAFLDDSNEIDRALENYPQKKPERAVKADDTPSRPQYTGDSLSSAKRVDFSPFPTYHRFDQNRQHDSPVHSLHRGSPLARPQQKPLKSILKQCVLPAPPTPDDLDSKLSYFSPEIPGSFAKMLQSVIAQLGSSKQDSRLDAYLALNGALKTYEDVPNLQSLQPKMGLLMQFITRDMAWKNAAGTLDVNIVTQAQKLAAAFLFDSKLSASLDDDFRSFIFDRSIVVLEQNDMPKAVVKGHMCFLAHKGLYTSLTSNARANRLITALHNVEERCSGNTAIATRLIIYTRLLEHAQALMLERSRDWLEHTFHGMLSSIKDIRIRGIEMCTTAGRQLGTSPKISKALRDMFETEVEDGQSYCDYLSLRLVEMIDIKDIGAYVPQIWSAVILFFRNQRMPLEKWSRFKSWLLIIQRCLNSSDNTIKYQAHLAWNRLVFAVMPDGSTSRTMLSMLKVPVEVGLVKRGGDKHSREAHQFACDSYINLLHYGLRPGLPQEQMDKAWDLYVNEIIRGLLKSRGRHVACAALQGLFSPSNGIWNADAVFEHTPIKPDELARLEPRFVRSRLGKILKLMEPMLVTAMHQTDKSNIAVDNAWHALFQCVAEAGSQEVKTSAELKDAIVHVVDLFRRLWVNATELADGVDTVNFFKRYTMLVTSAVNAIGCQPFAEDILTTNEENGLEAAPTPSHRPSKHHSAPHSPLGFLFSLLYHPPAGLSISPHDRERDIFNLGSKLLKLLISSKSTPAAQINLLNRSMLLWNSSNTADVNLTLAASLWACIATCTITILDPESSASGSHDSQSLGVELREVLNIESAGLKFLSHDAEHHEVAVSLYDAAFSTARSGASAGGTVLGIVEPFAKLLIDADSSVPLITKIRLATNLFITAMWPRSRQQLDQSRKSLWGVGLASHKTGIFDPFDHAYRLMSDVMTSAYEGLEIHGEIELTYVLGFFDAAIGFLKNCPISLLATALRKVQKGFAIWIADESRRTAANDAVLGNVSRPNGGAELFPTDFLQVQRFWRELLQLLGTLPNKDSILVSALETLITAGYSSPHKAIVNETIMFWNEEFGSLDDLTYPEKLQQVLRARLIDADINLPNFPDSNGQVVLTNLPEFFETQVDATMPKFGSDMDVDSEDESMTHAPRSAPVPQSHSLLSSRISLLEPLATSSPVRPATRRPSHSTPKARLRHEDSQIEFAPIDSSPVRVDNESQHLTEHQKEVAGRQLENVHLFPDLSSPMAQSTALPGHFSRRLSFHSDKTADEENDRTPTSAPDRNGNIMSDDVLSSPTPSSKGGGSGPIEVEKTQDLIDEEMQDPPSSPPPQLTDQQLVDEQYEVGPDETTIDGITINDVVESSRSPADQNDENVASSSNPDIDLPSDSGLPNEQLRQEEDQAASQALSQREKTPKRNASGGIQAQKVPVRRKTRESTVLSSQSVPQSSASQGEEAVDANPSESSMDNGGISRVEDSFVESVDHVSDVGDDSQQMQRVGRKCKRATGTGNTKINPAKKGKSPLKYFMNYLGQSQEGNEDDDDIEDEIIVASSQGASSPVAVKQERPSPSPRKSSTAPPEPAGENNVPLDEIMPNDKPPAKRGRGRGRRGRSQKSQTSILGSTEGVSTRSLKRKSSAMSNDSTAEGQEMQVTLDEAPTHAKTRKQHHDQVARSAEALQQANRSTDRVLKRPVQAVIPSPVAATKRVTRSADNSQVTSQEESQPEQSTPRQKQIIERPIATPRSMLSRLRGVLADLPKMILRSQDERDLDDVLFMIRKEAHNAAARAKE